MFMVVFGMPPATRVQKLPRSMHAREIVNKGQSRLRQEDLM